MTSLYPSKHQYKTQQTQSTPYACRRPHRWLLHRRDQALADEMGCLPCRQSSGMMQHREEGQDDQIDDQPRLFHLLHHLARLAFTQDVLFARLPCEFYHTSLRDFAWGCGYRNIQMLLSSLPPGSIKDRELAKRVTNATVAQLQILIEEAWQAGFDEEGARHFRRTLKGKRSWIGTTEVYALLTYLWLDARIEQFSGAHRADGLLGACQRHFSQDGVTGPLYFQHQGHSRTIIGYIESRSSNGASLVVLDPAKRVGAKVGELLLLETQELHRLEISLSEARDMLAPFLVTVKDLRLRDYQTLRIELQSSPLSESQREIRKHIPGTRG